MKTMIKTLAVGLALITMFSAILLVGAYALSAAPVERKIVSGDDFVDGSLFVKLNDAPVSQSDLQKKFSVYNIETADEQNKTLTYFTEEQAEQLKARKDSGEMFTLTYDEILFIISDSIQAYFNHNTIVLTKATAYGLIDSDRIQRSIDHHITCYHGDYSVIYTALYKSPDHHITCYHSDYSELEYDAAKQKYDEMIAGIYDIIVYRIAMLDSGFLRETYNLTSDSDPLLSTENGQFIKSFDNSAKDDYRAFLAEEWNNYKKKVEASFSGYYKPEDLAIELKAPLLFASYNSSAKMISTVETDCLTETTLYPTVELLAMRPTTDNTKKSDSRAFFENLAKNIYPEYDITSATPELDADKYAEVINEERLKGMSFCELVDTFGLPYDGVTSGFATGYYYLSTGETLTVYFDEEFNVHSYALSE